MKCSVLIPVYFNEGSIEKTYQKLVEKVLRVNIDYEFEIIFIDDGSGDGSYDEILKVKEQSSYKIKIIKFTRNFGQVAALTAGYKIAEGDAVINISADMQDPPEIMNEMLDFAFKEDYSIVIATRNERDELLFRRKTSQLFYFLMRKLSFSNMPEGGFDYALLRNYVVKKMFENNEANPFWQGKILWTGYKTKFIPYKRLKREIGKSRWTFGKKIKYLFDGVISYSFLPLRIMSLIGIIVAILGAIYAGFIVIAKILGNVPFTGWAPIMILILLLSGMQMTMLGIIGEYLWRTLDQSRKRPQYVIEKIIE